MKIIGFQAGQFGDLIMAQPLCRTVKKIYPNCHFTLGIGNKFKEAAGLFLQNEFIDRIHIWDSYDDFPRGNDQAYLNQEGFEIIYHPVPKVRDTLWFHRRYIIDEWRNSYNLPQDDNTVKLEFPRKIHSEYSDHVALSLFSWFNNSSKSLTFEQIQTINTFLLRKGYKTLQIGLSTEKDIGTTNRFIGTYSESAAAILSCKCLISIDTSYVWLASAFNFPTLGFFGYKVFDVATSSKNWQAKNANALYIEADKASNIALNVIDESLKGFLDLSNNRTIISPPASQNTLGIDINNIKFVKSVYKFKHYDSIYCVIPYGDDTSFGTFRAIDEGEFELDKVKFEPGDIILDIGCNVGLLSCVIAKNYPDVTVYAFDPNPIACLCAKTNAMENKLTNVIVINKAVGIKTEKNMKFCATKKQMTASVSFMFGPSDDHPEIVWSDQITMRDVFNNALFPIEKVKYCKIDIEGDEYNLIPHLVNNESDVLEKIEHFHLEVHNKVGEARKFSEYVNDNIGSKILNKNIFTLFN